ncbi:MAG: hypothetical protein ACK4YQ_02345 [Phenylobacterium sp.]|uniref:hypothetical protein n=1 Tax=Phenylobacterium sp. TaxID=1871053 RepID=UPI003918AAE6
MKTILIALAAASTLSAAAAAPAAAAPWRPVDQRQGELDRRIDMGVRNHSLTRAEAARLHGELQRIVRLERRYRQDGLSRWEMADLDRRMDGLSRQIRVERHDRQHRR